MPDPRRHVRRIAVVALAISVGVTIWLISRGLKLGTQERCDFFDFFRAAQAFPQGKDIYAAGDPGYIYPPLLAFIMQVLVPLGGTTAATVWVFLNAALATLLCWLGVDTARLTLTSATNSAWRWEQSLLATCVTFLLLADSFRNELEWGNCNFFVMLPVLLAIRWLASRPRLAGALLGLAAALKYLPILFLVWLATRRQWRAAAAMLISLVALLLAPALQVGWHRNAQFLGSSVRGVTTMLASRFTPPSALAEDPTRARTVSANFWPLDADYSLSIPSGMARVVRDKHLPKWLTPIGVACAAAACVLACALVYRAHGFRLWWRAAPAWLNILEGVGVSAAMVAFAPQTQKRHFNMLVAMIAWGVVVALTPGRWRTSRTVAIAALVLLALLTTPMINTPWTRDFTINQWGWFGGPAYVAVACEIMLIAATMCMVPKDASGACGSSGSLP